MLLEASPEFPIYFLKIYRYAATLLETGVDQPRVLEIWQWGNGRRVIRQTGVDAFRIAFSHNGEWLASAGKSPVRLWDTVSGKEHNRIHHEGFVLSLDFSADDRYLALGLEDRSALIWDLVENRRVARLQHPHAVDFITFSPDGKFVVTTSYARDSEPSDNTAYVWEVMSGRLVARLVHGDQVNALSFSRDGDYVATGSKDGNARLWRIPDGRELEKLKYDREVTHLALSGDGRYLATNTSWLSGEQDINVWSTSSGRQTMTVRHGDMVQHIAFTPDSKFFVSHNRSSVRISRVLPFE